MVMLMLRVVADVVAVDAIVFVAIAISPFVTITVLLLIIAVVGAVL